MTNISKVCIVQDYSEFLFEFSNQETKPKYVHKESFYITCDLFTASEKTYMHFGEKTDELIDD